MGQTTNYALPYPAGGDAPLGPAQLQDLANAVDAELTNVNDAITDTGQLTTLGVTMSSGWSLSEKLHRVFMGSFAFVRLGFTRTGAALEGSANSNIADTDILTITTTSLLPQWTQVMHIRFSNCGGGGELSAATGVLKLTDIPAGGDIGTGENGQVTLAYPLA